MPVPSRSLVPRVSVPFWLAPLRTFSTFASGAAIFVFLALGVISVFPRMQSAGTAAAPAAAQPGAFGAGGAAASPQSSQDLKQSAPSDPLVVSSDRSAARPSATPDAAKEIGRVDQSGPSSNNVTADQSTRQSAAPAPSPFVILLSPWLWLVVAIGFGALSFLVGRRLRSA
jgi:hypothetical protein